MRRRRWSLGLALGASFLFWALLVWALGWADDPLRFLVLSGTWTGIAAALLGWPRGMLAPLASLAVAAPALARQPLLVFASQTLFLLGLALVGSGLGFALRKGSSRRQLHRQLERSYGEEVFENSLNILHVIDREGNVVRRNRRSLELLGWPHRRSLHVTEYVHPQHLDEFRLELERLFERGELRDLRVRFLTESKHSLPVEVQARRVTGKLAVLEARDRSDLQKLEYELHQMQARYRCVIEAGLDTLDLGLILVDAKGEVLWANLAVSRFFGLDRDQWFGHHALQLMERISMVLEEGEAFYRRVREIYQAGLSEEGLVVQVRPGKGREERVLQYRSLPLATQDYKGGRVDYFADITPLKRLEAELREQKRLLEEANERLKAFNAALSHQLRNPARSALGRLHLVLSQADGALPPQAREDLENAKRCLERMDRMIEDLNRYAKMRLDPSQFEPVDLNRLLAEVREDLGPALARAELRVAADLPVVFGRPRLLAELFANLLHNAVKFNDKDTPVVEVGWRPHRADAYLFWVRDNGPGIPGEYLEKIFQLFERLDTTKEGTGAGLAICRRIVEEHGGRIWAESQLGQGATFYFTLPRQPVRRGVENDAR
ncbi:MAG: ATP-binding protein [Candidatus Bipolaricaulaceae bacterium]